MENQDNELLPQASEPAEANTQPLAAHPEPRETAPVELPAATPVPIAEEELERRRLAAETEKQLKLAIAGILQAEDEDFAQALEQASLQELTLLMEVIAAETIERRFLRRVGLLKKRFDKVWELTLERHKEILPDDKEGQKEKQRNVDFSTRFNEALAKFNKRKEQFEEEDAKAREVNTRIKQELLNQLRELVTKENAALHKEVKEIQNKWKETGPVYSQQREEINESYKALLDQFYSLRSSYLELVDQDRKVNLEAKQKLIAVVDELAKPAAEQATEPTWWAGVSERLNELHEEWKKIGPVPRKDSETIWQAFKQATERFYQARRDFYETRDELKHKNQDIKEQMLQQMMALAAYAGEDVQGWHQASEQTKALQEAWFAQGPAPKEVNTDFNRRFKALVNDFFQAKQVFFKGLDAQRDQLLEAKRKLAEQADALAESSEWDKTANTLKQLQQQWKTTGPDTHKDARKIQNRFRKACDKFFQRLKNRHAAAMEQEIEHLKAKEAVAGKLEDLIARQSPAAEDTRLEGEAREALTAQVQALLAEYQAIGEVPRKDAGRMANRWQTAWNRYLSLTIDDPSKLENIQKESKYLAIRAEKGQDALDGERKRLTRQIRELEEEITQFENNILFIQKGKKGDALRNEIQGKIENAAKRKAKLEKELRALKKADSGS
ncbi:MAG: DUF349 domain-containing protein [Bacteroidetes bacterium]|nr:DUF349 domain-containing protein [Bacteroidota bacterium]